MEDLALSQIVKQLESCGYNCEAGPLENNTAFIALKELAKTQESWLNLVGDCKTEFRIEQQHCDERELFTIDDYKKLHDSFYGPPAQERTRR